MQTPESPTPTLPPAAPGPEPAKAGHTCAECAGRTALQPEQYVYAIGRLDVRFPSLGIEREYQQRERAMTGLPQSPRGARIRAVLEKNPHLALRMTYVFLVGNS